MCGIGGIYSFEQHQPDKDRLDKMAVALSKRGPDGHGTFVDDTVGLVHTRLAIIDTAGGHQPMSNAMGVTIVFNGEIYNYKEIRENLKNHYPFQTQSDTETILALYDRYGLDFISYLRGMYAFALYDSRTKRCIIARDPFGIKPLYYTRTSQYIAFASEPKALLQSELADNQLDMDALRSVVRGHYIHGVDTPFPSIERFPEGGVLVIEPDGNLSASKMPAISDNAPRDLSESVALENLDTILKDSVSMHCRSDVGYGVFLSGGVDSSTILQTLSALNGSLNDIHTYTAYFDVAGAADEREYAASAARHCGTQHHEIAVTSADFFTMLPKIAAYMDDPVADYAILPTWKLAEVASQQQKVVLCGEGGDELFGGYSRYRTRWWKALRQKKKQNTSTASPLWSRLQQAQAKDIADYLPHDLLIKLDTCLMAHGLEGRTPFLDKVVADFAFTLPDNLKLRGRDGKYIVKKYLSERLPSIQPFRKKQGFTVPVGAWMASDAQNITDMLMNNDFIRELLNAQDVALLPKLLPNEKGAKQCWPLLYLAFWHEDRNKV